MLSPSGSRAALPQPLLRCAPGGPAVDNVVAHVWDVRGHSADENPCMTLTFAHGQPFAIAATAYQYRPATAHESMPRTTIEVAIEGVVTHAMVDIGSIYLVCHPRLATQPHLATAEAISGPWALLFRGVLVQGKLYQFALILLPQEGDDPVIQATAFVPEQQEEESWGSLPSIWDSKVAWSTSAL
jgi:hypothetical protein